MCFYNRVSGMGWEDSASMHVGWSLKEQENLQICNYQKILLSQDKFELVELL